MYLVVKSKYGINQLGYDPKKKEYVCFHEGKVQWRRGERAGAQQG